MTAQLKVKYQKEIVAALKKELGDRNLHALPQITKVSVNVGIGSAVTSGNKDYSVVERNLAAITGQKPTVKKARVSVSNFKLREGMPVGLNVTLRGDRMYDFVERLVNVALPRVRDFRGISYKSFDGQGNYSLGVKECTIFPEVDNESLSQMHGLQVNIQTNAKNDDEAYLLLKALGFPFKKDEAKASNK
jgi:large subunit ribosomal protein L5